MRVRPRVRWVGGRLSAAFANSRRQWEERRGALLVLEAEDGGWGQGECSPLPGFSVDEGGVEELFKLQSFELDVNTPLQDLPVLSPAATAALECAVLDLAGRARGLGVGALLGPTTPRRVSALLDAPPGPGLVGQAEAAFAAGYGAVKWKAGRPGRFAEELEALWDLRRALPGAAIRLDINQGWTFDEAVEKLARLEPLQLELVEEPCPPPFPPSPVPLGADESLLRPDGLALLGPSVRALVLKPMALGGARACRRLAAFAADRGLGVVVSHLLEGPVGLAFACEIASSLPGEVWACGLAPHAGLSAWPAVELPQLQGGWIKPADRGLGLPPLLAALEGE